MTERHVAAAMQPFGIRSTVADRSYHLLQATLRISFERSLGKPAGYTTHKLHCFPAPSVSMQNLGKFENRIGNEPGDIDRLVEQL